MNSRAFLKIWERLSGLRLIGEGEKRFLRDCRGILYLEPKHLALALKTASRMGIFDLRYIEAVALNARCAIPQRDCEVVDLAKAARGRRKRSR